MLWVLIRSNHNICFLREIINVRIHRECPCRIGKFHPRGKTFNQNRGLRFLSRGWDFPILYRLADDGFFFPPLSGLFLWFFYSPTFAYMVMWDRGFSHGQNACLIQAKVGEFQQGTRQASSLVEIPTPRVRFPYPAWTFMMDSYILTWTKSLSHIG